MGVNANLYLPAATRLRDVMDVIGRLISAEVTMQPTSSMAECTYIVIKPKIGKLVDGEDGHFVMYHFEGSAKGERLLMPPSTPFWIAVCVELVRFFGGKLDYNDCDESEVDLRIATRRDIHAEQDPEWTALQNRKANVSALTVKDLNKARAHAAYK